MGELGETATLIIQGGFAGACVLLMMFIYWLTKQLISLISHSNEVISQHTEVSNGILKAQTDQNASSLALRDELIKRPCMIGRE